MKSFTNISKYLTIIFSIFVVQCHVPPNAVMKLTVDSQESDWYKGKQIITIENDTVSIQLSFDRTSSGNYLFDVDVLNISDTSLLVDPQNFYYHLVEQDKNKNMGVVNAHNPETIIADLQKKYSLNQSRVESEQMSYAFGYFLTAVGQTAALIKNDDAASEQFDKNYDELNREEFLDDIKNQKIAQSLESSTFLWEILALRKTTLRKNESISGIVFFPVNKDAKTLEFFFPVGNSTLKIIFTQERIL